jgi:hypothetical protein
MNSPRTVRADIAAAATLLLILVPLAALPPFTVFVVWFLPIPLCSFFVHQFRWIPRWISLVIGVCLAFSGLGIAGFVFAYAIYILAQIIAGSIRKADNPYPAIVFCTLIFLMLFVVLLARLKWSGIHFYTELSKQLVQNSVSNYPLMKAENISPRQLSVLIINQLQLILPGALGIMAFLLSSVNFLLGRLLVRSVRERAMILLPWDIPYGVIYVYIISLTFVLFGWSRDSLFWWHAINSAMVFTGFLIGIQGLAFAWRKLYGRRKARFWMSILFLATLIPIVRSVYIFVGLFDSSIRARKL